MANKSIKKSKETTTEDDFLEPSFEPAVKSVANNNNGKRYLLFLGNLSYKSTAEEIKAFFEQEGASVVAVRISTDKKTKKPKGFAFCELDSAESLEIALGMHQTKFGGRKINVELTAGGGGHKSEKRKLKIKEKNEKYRQEQAELAEQ